MIARELEISSGESTCVIEPWLFHYAVLRCVGDLDVPLTLAALDDLEILAQACVLHDKVVVPNPLPPTFRHSAPTGWRPGRRNESWCGMPFLSDNSGRYYERDWLVKWLQIREDWGYIDLRQRLTGLGHTGWFAQVENNLLQAIEETDYREASRKFVAEGGGTNSLDPAERTVLEMILTGADTARIDILAYLDKIAVVAEERNATLALGQSDLFSLLQIYEKALLTPQQVFLSGYEATLRERLVRSGINSYRTVSLYAPMFLDRALYYSDSPEGLLANITRFHHHEQIAEFRRLCRHLQRCDQREANRLHKEVERLLMELAEKDAPIPSARGPMLEAMYWLIRIPLALIEGPGVVAEKGKEFWDWLKNKQEVEKADLYSALAFINQMHPKRRDLKMFYQELNRVFGKLDFSLPELEAHYA